MARKNLYCEVDLVHVVDPLVICHVRFEFKIVDSRRMIKARVEIELIRNWIVGDESCRHVLRVKNSISHRATQSNAVFRVGYRGINSVSPGPVVSHLLFKVD